jgi:hypothetical protein
MEDSARFDQAVQSFLRNHKIMDVSKLADNPDLLKKFLSMPGIAAYLTRPADRVHFNQKKEPVYTSLYEQAIYEVCAKNKAFNIPYRAYDRSKVILGIDSFYGSGMDPLAAKQLDSRLRDHVRRGHNRMPQDVHVDTITTQYDVYQVAWFLRSLQGERARSHTRALGASGEPVTLPKTGVSFLVFDTGKSETTDAHAFSMAAVIDNASRKVKCLLFANFSNEKSYFEFIEKRINIDVEQGNWDKEKKAQVYPEAFHVINCSLNLQTRGDDNNCGLYAHNISRALAEIGMNHPELIQELADDSWRISPEMKAAKAQAEQEGERQVSEFFDREKEKDRTLFSGSYSPNYERWHDEIITGKVHQCFRHTEAYRDLCQDQESKVLNALKAELPEYYIPKDNGSYDQRSWKEIDQNHLEDRWDIGSEYLKGMIDRFRQEARGQSTSR